MTRQELSELINSHPFLEGLDPAFLSTLVDCAGNVRIEAGQLVLREGESADRFYLITEGVVALEYFAPGRGAVIFQRLGGGDVLGVSWLVPPYRWAFDAMVEEQMQAIAFDARCLRAKCDENPSLGYQILNRFLPKLVERLQATRLENIDAYRTDK